MAGQVLPGPGCDHQLNVHGDSADTLLSGHHLHHLQLRVKYSGTLVVQHNASAVPHIWSR